MADLGAAARGDGAGAVGRGVAVADVRGLDHAVGREVAAGDEREDVLAGDVGARDPRAAVDDAGVDHVAHPRARRGPEHGALGRPRADVALHEAGLLGQVALGGGLDLCGEEGHLGALEVDVAVAGDPHDDELARAVEVGEREHDVLQGVGGGPCAAVLAGLAGVREVDEGGDGGGVWRVEDARGGLALDGDRLGHERGERLDVGRVAAGAAHEGVLADGRGVQELLALGPAHGAGVRGDDDVLEAEALEDPLVGVALGLVADGEAGVGVVEGVGVLHRELAARGGCRRGDGPRRGTCPGSGRSTGAGPCTRSRGPSRAARRTPRAWARAPWARACGPRGGTSRGRTRRSGPWPGTARRAAARGSAPPGRRCAPSPRGRWPPPCS